MTTVYKVPLDIPLIGAVQFGIIDRGTNVVQVRPSTACPLSCIFCSTDAGPRTTARNAEYIVELEHILDWFGRVARTKGRGVEAHIDTVGDPLVYPRIADLVQDLASTSGVETVSLQTHGHLLSESLIDGLAAAGLSRINLSVDALDPQLARELAGTPSYDVERVLDMAKYAIESAKIDLLLAPVWVNPLNTSELDGFVSLAKSLGAGKRCPPLGIQKCERHRFGRKDRRINYLSWYSFYESLRGLGSKHGINLILRPSDFGIRKAGRMRIPYTQGEKLKVTAVGPGWLKGETLAVDWKEERLITVVGTEAPPGEEMFVRLLRVKDNIFVARTV
ncbi:MAG: radical SAM protein [Candidatus Verstraetearchaeota archaeon]|nr:radical SAM protein [Candidatus Verstraetearchaeota archaeon]